MSALSYRNPHLDGMSSAGAAARKPHILVVDDDVGTRDFLHTFLAERGYEALVISSADEALRSYERERPAAVILDIGGPGTLEGLRALDALKRIDREIPIIVLSGQGLTTTVMQAMTLGAACFISKPFDTAGFDIRLTEALSQQQVRRQVASLRQQLQSHTKFPMLFGPSERMAEIATLIERVADTDVTILIRGESGTGKELLARALVASSNRASKPFIKVNCTAIPTEILEAELFGVERGAFTSAVHKPGKFEFANHGTMFLDEIGDISVPLQTRFTRILQNGEFSRLGGTRDIRVDVRVIAATNRDLERAVAEGRFKADFLQRLNAFAITMPALRDRRCDIPLLTDHFLKKYSVQDNRALGSLSPEVARLFMEYDWPGNVRELENVIRRAVVLGSDAPIARELAHNIALTRARPPGAAENAEPAAMATSAAVRSPMLTGAATLQALTGAALHTVGTSLTAETETEAERYSLKDVSRQAAHHAERELILKILQRTHWNRKAAAAILNISYKALLYKIKENGLDDHRS